MLISDWSSDVCSSDLLLAPHAAVRGGGAPGAVAVAGKPLSSRYVHPPSPAMPPATLPDWLAYIERQHPRSIDMGLERVREVAGRMELARPARQVITVGGPQIGSASWRARVCQYV